MTAIDATAGSVTLDHGPIAALEWPAMTMGFSANPKILKDIAVGDRVAFELDWDGKAGVVTQIAKRGRRNPEPGKIAVPGDRLLTPPGLNRRPRPGTIISDGQSAEALCQSM